MNKVALALRSSSMVLDSHNRQKNFGLRIAFALVLTMMLIAGLTPGEYRFRNEVSWIGNGAGLQFERYGIVYTPPFLTESTARSLNQSGATLLLGLRLPPVTPRGFQFIASFHNGDDGSQVVVAQWQNSLIVMNGNDYSHVRRTPRVSADLSSYLDRPILLAISTSPSGTLLAIDGEIIGGDAKLQILMPTGARNARLTLGNSVHSNNGWSGSLLSFGVLSRALTGTELKSYHAEWFKARDLKFVPPVETIQLLHFGETRFCGKPRWVHTFRTAIGGPNVQSRLAYPERHNGSDAVRFRPQRWN